MHKLVLMVVTFGTLLLTLSARADEPSKGISEKKIDFQKDVAPILTRHCIQCHGANSQLAGLRLDESRYVVTKDQDSGLIQRGQSAKSLLIRRLTDKKLGLLMPPGFPFYPEDELGLPNAQIQILARWIDEGASWPEGVVLTVNSPTTAKPEVRSLFAAIRASEVTTLKRLLDDSSLVNVRDRHGATPLMYAALYSDVATMKVLIEHGMNLNSTDESGATALMWAAGDIDKVRLLLKHGAKADVRSHIGRTPLLIASTYAGNIEVIKLLLQSGAKITDKDKFGETVLTSAAKRGDAQVLEVLIAAGADVQVGGGFQGRTPLAWAAEEGTVEAMACLLKHGAGKDPRSCNSALFNAAVRGPASAVQLLLEHGADPRIPSGFAAYTPLMGAAYSENLDLQTVKLLLKHGADVNAKAVTGDTALTIARRRGQTPIVELLEKAGAKE